jgi:hypothetical protein
MLFNQQDAGLSTARQSRQRGLAIEERAIPQILTIMLDQVEGIEDPVCAALLRRRSSKRDRP